MDRAKTSRWAVLAAVGWVLSAPVLAWWQVGDQSAGLRGQNAIEDIANADHLLPPLVLSATAERAAGITAAVIFTVCAMVVVRAWWKRRLGRRWRPTVVMLVLAGAALGAGWRVVSAGRPGADPVAGQVLLIGLPGLVAFVGAAVVVGIARRPDRRLNHGPDPPPEEPEKPEKGTHIREDSPVSSADRV